MGADVLERIRALLSAAGVEYREVTHEPTLTSEDSARARGEELRVGGKALVLKVDGAFRLFVLSAARKLDSAAIKRHFQLGVSPTSLSLKLRGGIDHHLDVPSASVIFQAGRPLRRSEQETEIPLR